MLVACDYFSALYIRNTIRNIIKSIFFLFFNGSHFIQCSILFTHYVFHFFKLLVVIMFGYIYRCVCIYIYIERE